MQQQTVIVDQATTQLTLAPHTDFVIKYNPDTQQFSSEEYPPTTHGLSDQCKQAVIKSPQWMQPALIEQFHHLSNPEPYSTLILQAPQHYTDELAFSIAYSPLGAIPSAELLLYNVQTLYTIDSSIRYADIIDFNSHTPNYTSTITYTLLEKNTAKTYILSPAIYYWYIVHPKLGQETPEIIYNRLWRSYLFYHNDRSYPLLKELVTPQRYLWDNHSYRQPGNRLWTESITSHPTAIEACSYWVGKTVPAQAIGSRPGQPNIIAHEHNGWCGELARLATAAQRSLLIPSVGAYNVGEDHVWREFYHKGWHQNDNYWTDSGGTVDVPDEYAYNWGKNMSAIYQWRGDDIITDVTARYIHPEDRITVTFQVIDQRRQPLDGARIVAVVQGPKDITWYKLQILEIVENIWEKIPDPLKGQLLFTLYENIQQKIANTPDIIEGHTITTWNYSDTNGRCTLTLGENHDYLFVIQYGNLKKPWLPARKNTIRIHNEPTNKTFHIFFPMITTRLPTHRPKRYRGDDLTIHLQFTSEGYQLQENFRTTNIGRFETKGNLIYLILDKDNYEKYQQNRRFRYAAKYQEESLATALSLPNKEWYIVMYNPTKTTQMKTDLSIESRLHTQQDTLSISTPSTTHFEHPSFSVGDLVIISGIATKPVTLKLPTTSVTVPLKNQQWRYQWNTTHLQPGMYTINATIPTQQQDTLQIQLIDATPPYLTITQPDPYSITSAPTLSITGTAADNHQLHTINIALDNQPPQQAQGTTTWKSSIDISSLELGNHNVTISAEDMQGHTTNKTLVFVKNETNHSWGPHINELFSDPPHPTNTSTISIYANITTTGPYPLKQATLSYTINQKTQTKTLSFYATNPEQTRHSEDPLSHQTNTPIYGCLLGEYPTNTTITYSLIATDTAHNTHLSDTRTITITT